MRVNWSSRLIFIMAATGSAVGLGNLWKFPYIAGINGGGAFVLVYLFSICLVGLPALISEMYIGQQAQTNPVEAFEVLDKKNTPWRISGATGLAGTFCILAFYITVGGWVMDFEWRSLIGELSAMGPEQVKGALDGLFANPMRQLFWHTIFMVLTALIVFKGVKDGLEKYTKILMPALGAILIGLFFYSMTLPGFSKALGFLFAPDFSKLTTESILEAVGHSFFTLSVGASVMMTFGSYLKKGEGLVKTTLMIGFLDTAIALIGGLVIFSIVFTYNQEPSAGPGLMFSTLPSLFAQMPGGRAVSSIFFLLIVFAALSSSVSLLEALVSYAEERAKMTRQKATIVISTVIYLVGILTVLSTNVLGNFKIFGKTFFGLFDLLSSSYLLPITGMLVSMFVGWKLGREHIEKMMNTKNTVLVTVVYWILRVITPVSILVIMANVILKG